MWRIVWAIVSTLAEEMAIVAIGLWGLPSLGVQVPLSVLFVVMVGWIAVSVLMYRVGKRVMMRKAVAGLSNMITCDGEAVTPVAPDGMVRINGELWSARSVGGMIKEGEAVEVVGQEKLRLLVRRCQPSNVRG